MNDHFSKLLDFKNGIDCCYHSNLSISAIFFGFPKIILLKNLVSPKIVKNSIEFSLLDLGLEAFLFHFALLEKE